MANRTRGKLVVISAPSGAGKTTLVHGLIEKEPKLRFSISYTTRPKRPSEVDGKDYRFVDETEFERLRDDGAFLEYAQVFDHWYGTSRADAQTLLDDGYSVLLEIDWQGAEQIRAAEPSAIDVFILPPSRTELERRLRGRGTDDERVIARRLADAVSDMGHWADFDYVVINDDVDTAVGQLVEILDGTGEAHRVSSPGASARAQGVLSESGSARAE